MSKKHGIDLGGGVVHYKRSNETTDLSLLIKRAVKAKKKLLKKRSQNG